MACVQRERGLNLIWIVTNSAGKEILTIFPKQYQKTLYIEGTWRCISKLTLKCTSFAVVLNDIKCNHINIEALSIVVSGNIEAKTALLNSKDLMQEGLLSEKSKLKVTAELILKGQKWMNQSNNLIINGSFEFENLINTGTININQSEVKGITLSNQGSILTKNSKINFSKIINSSSLKFDNSQCNFDQFDNNNLTSICQCSESCSLKINEQITNKGGLSIENGTFIFKECINSDTGTLNFSKSKISGDDLKNFHQVKAFKCLQEYNNYTNNGRTDVREGSITINEQLINQNQWISERAIYKIEKFTNKETGTLSLLSQQWNLGQKSQIQYDNQFSPNIYVNDGRIESDHSLHIHNATFANNIYSREDIIDFTLGGVITPDIINKKLEKVIKMKGYYCIYGDSFQILKNESFVTNSPIKLILTGNFVNNGTWEVSKNLCLEISGQCINGTSNDLMGQLIVKKELKITAANIDNRFGEIFSNGNSVIESITGDIQVGNVKLELRPTYDTGIASLAGTGHHQYRTRQYNHSVKNQAYITSNGTLNIIAAKDLKCEFGEIYSTEKLLIQSKQGSIFNNSGIITSSLDMILKAHVSISVQRGAPQQGFYTLASPWRSCDQTMMLVQLHTSDAGLFQSLGDIYFGASTVINRGSVIQASKSIYYNDALICGNEHQFQPQQGFQMITIEVTNFVCNRYHQNWVRDYMWTPGLPHAKPYVLAGKEINIDTNQNVSVSGTMDAPKMSIKCNNFFARDFGIDFQEDSLTTLEIDLVEVAKQFNGSFFCNKNENGIYTTKHPVTAKFGLDPDQLTLIRSTDNNQGKFKSAIDPATFDFILQNVLRTNYSSLNLRNQSGAELRDDLLFNNGPNKLLESLSEARQTKKSMIMFMACQVQALINQSFTIYRPILTIPKSELKPLYSCQGIKASRLSIEAEEDIVLINNKVIISNDGTAQKDEVTLLLDAKNQLIRDSEVSTIKYIDGNYDVSEDVIFLKQTIKSDQDGVSILRGQTKGILQTSTLTHVSKSSLRFIADQGNIESRAHVLRTERSRTYAQKGSFFKGDTEIYECSTSHKYDVDKIINDTNDIEFIAGQHQLFEGSQISGNNIFFKNPGSLLFFPVYESVKHQILTKSSGGIIGKRSRSDYLDYQQNAIGGNVTASKRICIEGQSQTSFTATNLKAQEISVQSDRVEINQGRNVHLQMFSNSSADIFWQSCQQKSKLDITFTETTFEGKLSIISPEILIEQLKGKVLPYIEQIISENSNVKIQTIQETHEEQEMSQSGPGIGLIIIATLAVGMYCPQIAASLSSALSITNTVALAAFKVGLTSAIKLSTVALLQSKGDPVKAIKSLATKETLKTIAIDIVTSLSTSKVFEFVGYESILKSQKFVDILKTNIVQASVSTSIQMAANNLKLEDAFAQGVQSLIVATVGNYFAGQIGRLYLSDKFDYFSHKASHAVLGGVLGSLFQKDPRSGAIAGALGALTAEIFCEFVIPIKNKQFTKEQIDFLTNNEEMQKLKEKGRIVASVVALFSGLNVQIAQSTATNAISNNFFQAIPIIISLTVRGAVCAIYLYGKYQTSIDIKMVIENDDDPLTKGIKISEIILQDFAAGKITANLSNGFKLFAHKKGCGEIIDIFVEHLQFKCALLNHCLGEIVSVGLQKSKEIACSGLIKAYDLASQAAEKTIKGVGQALSSDEAKKIKEFLTLGLRMSQLNPDDSTFIGSKDQMNLLKQVLNKQEIISGNLKTKVNNSKIPQNVNEDKYQKVMNDNDMKTALAEFYGLQSTHNYFRMINS